MIFLFTDFRYDGPYVGQMKAVLSRLAPSVPIIDLMHDAPSCDPKRAAYLLAALAQESQLGDIWLCVVDPGVGGSRRPVVLDCGGVCFVGPDNGLFELISRRIEGASLKEITWRPEIMSATFHGRDLFAPVTAWMATGIHVETASVSPSERRNGADWPDNLPEVIYIDAYGNLVTGIGGSLLSDNQSILVGGRILQYARKCLEVPKGDVFWHRNSMGLIEISANCGRADELLDLQIGFLIEVL